MQTPFPPSIPKQNGAADIQSSIIVLTLVAWRLCPPAIKPLRYVPTQIGRSAGLSISLFQQPASQQSGLHVIKSFSLSRGCPLTISLARYVSAAFSLPFPYYPHRPPAGPPSPPPPLPPPFVKASRHQGPLPAAIVVRRYIFVHPLNSFLLLTYINPTLEPPPDRC